ncbi:MAG TPA: L-threonylcarbamoyladenylate synthase, partial [Bryobacteraceae bacterium]|nr:L-threonylcarbamoyladenylate synthase [Bryobacteraceae bacterium]
AWPDAAEVLARKYWPGPLSLVLPKIQAIPSEVTAGLATVGVRAPSHPIALELIREAGIPLAAPSANLFTHLSPTEANHVRESLGGRIDAILDGGRTTVGIESTVLSLAGEEPVLLRPGMISRQELESVIGGPIQVGGAVKPNQAHTAPGMHEKHYSPATPLLLTSNPPPGSGAYLWWQHDQPGVARRRRMPANPQEYAQELYAVLHDLDRDGLPFIALEPVPAGTEWDGIRDRLQRASLRIN